MQEETQRIKYYDKTLPYLTKFPLADQRGDRNDIIPETTKYYEKLWTDEASSTSTSSATKTSTSSTSTIAEGAEEKVRT